MKLIYLDTNIFIYLADKNSPFQSVCLNLIKSCQKKGIAITTSVETFQEIIHYAKNISQLSAGIRLCKKVKRLVDKTLAVDEKIIDRYLQLASKYKKVKSRDLVHLAVSLENKLQAIISYDKEFKRFEEIKSASPSEFLRYHC